MLYSIDQLKDLQYGHSSHRKATLSNFHDDIHVIGFDGSLIDNLHNLEPLVNCYLYIQEQYWWKVDEEGTARFIHRPNEAAEMAALLLS